MLAALVSLCCCVQAPGPTEAQQVIRKARAALGRVEIEGEYATRATGTLTHGSFAQQYTLVTAGSGKLRFESTWVANGRTVRQFVVSDGARCWEHLDGVTRECTPEEEAVVRGLTNTGAALALTDLDDPNKHTLTLLPETKVGDEACVGVRVRAEGKRDIDMYFGSQTYLLRRIAGQKPCPDGRLRDYTVDYSGYKKFSGESVATKQVITIAPFGSAVQTAEKVEYVPIGQTAKLFEKP